MSGDIKIGWQDIYDAYRKLKSYVYYDATSLFLRERIAQFEATHFKNCNKATEENCDFVTLFQHAFLDLFTLLQEKSINNSRSDSSNKFNTWLKEIECIPVPKKVKLEEKWGDDVHFITNYCPVDKIEVSGYNCLIDAPVEIHVLAVLWILKVGVRLTEYISPDNYAYLLNTKPSEKMAVVDTNDRHQLGDNAVEILPGLSLFKPYFVGYKDWRDRGLEKAMKELDENKPVVILSLDITRYYYNVRVNVLDEVKSVLGELSSSDQWLCTLLQKVHEAYAEKLKEYPDLYSLENENHNNFPLPIGLLSSGILANLYLRDFDEYIKEYITPAYYGRYVDDILMVFAGKTIDFRNGGDQNNAVSPIDWFIKTHLIGKKVDGEGQENLNSHDSKDLGTMVLGESISSEGDKKREIVYLIRARSANLKIQSKKVIMEYFRPEESRAAINKFRKKLEESSSEFRLLPFETKVDEEFDNDAFRLEYNDSINKLRSIQSINEDKFGASKFLAQKIFLSILPFTADERENSYQKKSGDQILTFFKGRNTIAMNNLWEKVATYFLVNGDMKRFVKFYHQTLAAINKIVVETNDDNPSINKIEKSSPNEVTRKIKETAVKFLILGMSMALALDPAKRESLKGKIKKEDFDKIKNYIENFRQSYMFRHQYQYIKGLCYTHARLDDKISLLGREVMNSSIGKIDIKKASFLSPVFLKMEDIAILTLLNHLSSDDFNSNPNS